METPYYPRFFVNDFPGRFQKVDPAENRRAQQSRLVPLGVTLAAFISHGDRWAISAACDRLRRARATFQPFDVQPHLTIQGILTARQPTLSGAQRAQLIAAAAEAARRVFSGVTQFRVHLCSIQAGRRNGNPVSDGTVVWIAPQGQNSEIVQLSGAFREALNAELPNICPEITLSPGQPGGMWITLGYFNECNGFPIEGELASTFHELQYATADVLIDRVAVVEFAIKSLADSRVLDQVPLEVPEAPIPLTVRPQLKVILSSMWVDFHGWSFLFDNPGGSLKPFQDLAWVACQVWGDPALNLYRALADGLAAIDLDSTNNRFSFCSLPASSYHVTALDGINDENLTGLDEPVRMRFAELLRGLPSSFAQVAPDLIDLAAFADIIPDENPLRFKFDKLSLWGNKVLVACLEPADPESERTLAQVIAHRNQLEEQFEGWGRRLGPDFKPHVSLGYFANQEAAAAAQVKLPDWTSQFLQITQDLTIEFCSISAYGFTDMTCFFKRRLMRQVPALLVPLQKEKAMSCELRYLGRREAGGKERYFRFICSKSSRTLEKQKTRFDPPGLTVVAYIPHEERRPFQEAIDIIADTGYRFQSCEQLHFTILGLFAGDLPGRLGRAEVATVISSIDEFVRSRAIGRLEVGFDFLRPGIFVGQPGKGDGTVVTMASEAIDATIVEYSKELSAHLLSTLPEHFHEARRRPLGGVWCSLGFFDEPDFAIDKRVFEAFRRLERFSATVHIDEVAVTEFTLKSLSDGVVRGIVRL